MKWIKLEGNLLTLTEGAFNKDLYVIITSGMSFLAKQLTS